MVGQQEAGRSREEEGFGAFQAMPQEPFLSSQASPPKLHVAVHSLLSHFHDKSLPQGPTLSS